MPWWVQMAYLEGLDEDESVPFHFRWAGSSSAPTDQVDPVHASDDQLRAMGITVMRPNG